MSQNTGKPIIPSITGIPVLDSIIGSGLIFASTALASVSVTWMNSHGFQGADTTQISGIILGVLVLAATVTWRFIAAKRAVTAVADHVITAAATGQIPDSVMREAIKSPLIPDAKIEKAVQNTEIIKENQ